MCSGDKVDYDQFLLELAKADLSVKEFATLIGMTPNSVTNYARKDVPSHLAIMSVLMAEMNSNRLNIREALAKVQLAKKKPRGGAMAGRFGNDRQTALDFLR